jgi:hypothetical protein
MIATTGPYPLNGVHMPTWLIRFDKYGACTSPATRAMLLDKLRSAPPSDVIVFSHGWNNDFDDAAGMYAEFLRNFETLTAAHAPSRPYDPIFVGILWPSIWLSFDDGPTIAAGDPGRQAGGADALLAELADRIAAAGGAAGLERVYALLAAPGIDDADAAELARLIAPAFGVIADEGAAGQGRDTVADDVLAMMHAMELSPVQSGALQSDDIDDFSRPADLGAAGAQPAGPRAAGGLGLLDPRNALRLFSLYQMKDRAGTVGFNGVATLLRDLLSVPALAADGTAYRVHAVGHSFGCKVMLSAICAPQPLPRPVSSLLLLQPAISHLCFADAVPGTGKPGGYRDALSAQRVIPPIFSTYTGKDIPLHDAFHLAVRRASDLGEAQIAADSESTTAGQPPSQFAALGGYGPRRAAQVLIDPLPPAGFDLALPDGAAPIVAFDGSNGLIKGHGDITGPALAWALHRLVFR